MQFSNEKEGKTRQRDESNPSINANSIPNDATAIRRAVHIMVACCNFYQRSPEFMEITVHCVMNTIYVCVLHKRLILQALQLLFLLKFSNQNLPINVTRNRNYSANQLNCNGIFIQAPFKTEGQ